MKLYGKTTSLIFVIVLCAIALCCPVNAGYDEERAEPVISDDYVFTSGDWQYYPLGENISVCGYTGSRKKITVPSEIDGKRVTRVTGRKTNVNLMTETDFSFADEEKNNEKSFFSGNAADVKEVIIPEGVLSIGIYTFQNSGIEKITLPKSLISIGYKAFWKCERLETAAIPENVKIVGGRAFGESGLKEVYLPEGLESIGSYAFDSTHIKQIYIPDTVTEIGNDAFKETELEEVALPNGILKAEGELFYRCKELKKAYISEGTTSIDGALFKECSKLEEIYLPSTAAALYNMWECGTSLKTVNLAFDREKCEALFGDDLTEYFISPDSTVSNKQWANNLSINYSVPVPIPEPVPYPDEKFGLDEEAIFFAVITALEIILTAVAVISFIKRAKGVQKKRSEAKIKEEKEGFHPEILGVWQCEKCRTPNSPIADYCYKCGRKRGKNQ